MTYSRLACALPLLALAAAAAQPLATSAPATSPAQASPADDANTATIVIRYDPSTIYLTGQLVNALSRSSVDFEAPDGAEWADEAPSLGLEIGGHSNLERQPPGVFTGEARLTGPQITGSSQEEAMSIALESLQGALSERLNERLRASLERRIQQHQERADAARDQLTTLARRRGELTDRIEVGRRLGTLERELRALEMEKDVAANQWRNRRAQIEQLESELAQAQSSREPLAQDVEQLRALYEAGAVKVDELTQAQQKLRMVELEITRATQLLQSASNRVAAAAAQRDETTSRAGAIRAEIYDLRASITELTAEVEARSAAELSVEEQSLKRRLVAIEQSLAQDTTRLESLIPVTVTRW